MKKIIETISGTMTKNLEHRWGEVDIGLFVDSEDIVEVLEKYINMDVKITIEASE